MHNEEFAKDGFKQLVHRDDCGKSTMARSQNGVRFDPPMDRKVESTCNDAKSFTLSSHMQRIAINLNLNRVLRTRPSAARSRHTRCKQVHFDPSSNEVHIIPPRAAMLLPKAALPKYDLTSPFTIQLNDFDFMCETDPKISTYLHCISNYYDHVCLGGPPLPRGEQQALREGLALGYRGIERWSKVGKYRRTRICMISSMIVKAQANFDADDKVNGISSKKTRKPIDDKLAIFSAQMSAESKMWALATARDDAIAAQEE